MKVTLALVLGFLCWTVFAGSAWAQAAASAGGGSAAASASAAPAVLMSPPVVVQQAVPAVVASPFVVQRVGCGLGGCGLGRNVIVGGGGVSAAVAVGGVGGNRIGGRRGRTVIRQRVRVR